jgi:DNA-binding transcriptional regulator YiaG
MTPTNQTPQQSPRIETRPYEICLPTADGKQVAERIPIEVPMEYDATIDSWLLTPEAMLQIENIKARHMGLLLPDEIRALREKLNKTQAEMADLLQIGDKTWTLWENGWRRPSQSMNKLLKTLQAEANWTTYFGEFLPLSILPKEFLPAINWMPAIEATREESTPLAIELEQTESIGNFEEIPLAA